MTNTPREAIARLIAEEHASLGVAAAANEQIGQTVHRYCAARLELALEALELEPASQNKPTALCSPE